MIETITTEDLVTELLKRSKDVGCIIAIGLNGNKDKQFIVAHTDKNAIATLGLKKMIDIRMDELADQILHPEDYEDEEDFE